MPPSNHTPCAQENVDYIFEREVISGDKVTQIPSSAVTHVYEICNRNMDIQFFYTVKHHSEKLDNEDSRLKVKAMLDEVTRFKRQQMSKEQSISPKK